MSKFIPLTVRHIEDGLDSKRDRISIIDAESFGHPQGPLVIADMNVAAFAPHLETQIALAHKMAAAQELLEALEGILLEANYTSDSDSADRGERLLAIEDMAKVAIAKAKGN